MDEPAQFGEETRRNIAEVAELVAEMFRPCLGPLGMAKLVKDKDGLWLSDDPSLLLSKAGLQNPTAKILSDSAASITKSVGDGACSFLIIIARLLKGAKELVDKETRPNTIVNGWRLALDHCLQSPGCLPIEPSDRLGLSKVAKTVISDYSSVGTEALARLTVDALSTVPATESIDLNNFYVERAEGGAVGDSFLVKGLAMPHELGDPMGPRSAKMARIALLKGEMNEWKPPNWRADTKIEVGASNGILSVLTARTKFLTGLADCVVRSGANVVFIEKGMNPIAIEHLSKHGVMVVRRVVIEGLERLARATGGRIVYDIRSLSRDDLGFAGLVESRMLSNHEWVFVEGCKDPKAVTFVLRRESDTLLNSTSRLVKRSIKAVKEAQMSRQVVYGGGAWEEYLAQRLRVLSLQCDGRQQLAVNLFGEALEEIASTLAENAGMDQIKTIADLRASHANGGHSIGIDSRHRKLADMAKLGVLDPFSVKRRVLLAAFGVGAMLIRIDKMIIQRELFGEEKILKEREKHTDPERMEKRRREYGGMEKLEWPRWRPSKETRRIRREPAPWLVDR